MNELAALRRCLNPLLERYRYAKRLLKEERRTYQGSKQETKDAAVAQHVLQDVAKQVQDQAHQQISNVVTRCLTAVFDAPYTFQMVFEKKRGRTEARPTILLDGHELDPKDDCGGGVVDVVAFAQRIADLLLARPARRRLLVADEPWKSIHSPVYRERMRELLETLAEELDIQFLIVTGIEDYETGKVIRL
jgi:hypothetical protein